MALIANGMRAGGGPYSFRFGTAYGVNRAAYHSTGQLRNFHAGPTALVSGVAQSRPFGRPSGDLAPTSWSLPIVGGAIKSRSTLITVDASAVGSRGANAQAAAIVVVGATATGGLIVLGVASANIAITGTAVPAALVNAAANATVNINATATHSSIANAIANAIVSVNAAAASQGYAHIVATTVEAGLTPTGIAAAVWDTMKSVHSQEGTFGNSLQDTYQAKIWFTDDNTAATDRWGVVFFKNGSPLTSDILSVQLRVIRASTGADLIAFTGMTAVSGSSLYRYDATTTERLADGESYFAVARLTLASGGSHDWYQPVSRDS